MKKIDQLTGDPGDVGIPHIKQNQLIIGGEFRAPDTVTISDIKDISSDRDRVRRTVIYALELCGVIEPMDNLDNALQRLKHKLPKLPDGSDELEMPEQNIPSFIARRRQALQEVNYALLPHEIDAPPVWAQIDRAQEFDAGHNKTDREYLAMLAENADILGAPCFEEVRAMQTKDGIDPETADTAIRTLYMMALSDIHHLQTTVFAPERVDEYGDASGF